MRVTSKIVSVLVALVLAVSLVGASVIWRFMYAPRDASVEQTGLLNALWVGLGRLSTGSGIPTIVVAIVTGVALLALIAAMARAPLSGGDDAAIIVHLDGPWGSGKSTILKLLKSRLEASQPQWLVVEYNAWRNQHRKPAWLPLVVDLRIPSGV